MSDNGLVLRRRYDKLLVEVYETRDDMGRSAAEQGSKRILEVLEEKGSARLIFAAAPSANEFLANLCQVKEIDWSKITVFHMDEYIGLPTGAPQLFSNFLKRAIFDKVNPGTVHLIDSTNDPEKECQRYADLLNEAPIDIVFMGIGENGHLAFNDPPVADFNDPFDVKIVELDEVCRNQQVNDGCFATIDDVPTHAITLTIPRLLRSDRQFCIVPGPTKTAAVSKTLYGPMSTECPASVLRNQENCILFLDKAAYGKEV